MMHSRYRTASFVAAAFAAAFGGAFGSAQQGPPAGAPAGGGGRGGGAAAAGFFTAVDANKDGATTRDEMRSTFERWFTEWDAAKAGTLGQDQIATGLTAAMPAPAAPAGGFGGGRGAQNQTPQPQHVDAMVAALPATAPAKPKQPRKVLVLGKAAGFVHSSIPLAGRTVEELGKKTGAWSTTITYDPADINEQNLKQYDGVFLASTTGAFLDDPNDAAATAARRKALLDFVRGGKGLMGIHAATDSYHQNAPAAPPAAAAPAAPGAGAPGAPPAGRGRGGFGGGRGGAAPLAAAFVAQGDKNSDQRLSKDEFVGLADVWYGKLDSANAGRVTQAEFGQRYVGAILPPPPPAAAAASTFAPPRPGCTGYSNQQASTALGPDNQVGTWPEFNKMIGGFFKWHWNNPQEITYKIDEPNHPLNAPFKKLSGPLVINDETYTMGRDTYSRQNVRVLTSVDYSKMCDEDKKKEVNPREDHDYALSWIKRDGKGRVFYMTHGHDESVYAKTPLLEHMLAGMQYALGDLQADDSPSVKGGTK
jgi:type 1 glutamine amidotransferase